MTGKQLKDFAAKLHDEAVVEIDECYRSGWRELELRGIRARHMVMPDIEVPVEDATLRNLQTVNG